MNRAEHLKAHDDRADKRERTGESIAALHGSDEHAYGDRERSREGFLSARGPSTRRQRGQSLPSVDGEELPLLAPGQ